MEEPTNASTPAPKTKRPRRSRAHLQPVAAPSVHLSTPTPTVDQQLAAHEAEVAALKRQIYWHHSRHVLRRTQLLIDVRRTLEAARAYPLPVVATAVDRAEEEAQFVTIITALRALSQRQTDYLLRLEGRNKPSPRETPDDGAPPAA